MQVPTCCSLTPVILVVPLIISANGVVLPRELEEHLGIVSRPAGRFTERLSQVRIGHSVNQLVRQRLFAPALGNEDINDHDELRRDRTQTCGRGTSSESTVAGCASATSRWPTRAR